MSTHSPSVLTAPTTVVPASIRAKPAGRAGLCLAMLLASLATSSANVALPALADFFGASLPSIQWVVLAYLLTVTTAIVSAGRLGDLFGRRRVLLIGILVFTAGAALCGVAPTLPWLVTGRATQGVGAAGMMALALALMSETAPPSGRGSAVGVLGTISAVGTALGPSLGGVLIATGGWRALFVVNVPLGLFALMLVRRHVRPDGAVAQGGGRVDFVGTGLLGLAVGAYVLALTLRDGGFGALNAGLLLGGAVAAAGFVIHQRQAAAPLLSMGLLRDRGLSTGLALVAVASLVVMATLVVGPFHLMHGLGLDAATTGLVLTVGPLVAAVVGVPAGRLVDRTGARRMTFAGLVGMAIGCGALALGAAEGIAGYVLPVMVLTAGYALFQTANNTGMLAAMGAGRRGMGAGLVGLARNLGLLTGAAAMGAVFAFASASDLGAPAREASAAGMRATFGSATLLVLGGLGLLALDRPTAAGWTR